MLASLQSLRQLASQGHAASQFNLGNMYEQGRGGLAKDDAMAVEWYRKAAEQGDATAQCGLGFMYDQGRGGLAKDESKVIELLTKAKSSTNAYIRKFAEQELAKLGVQPAWQPRDMDAASEVTGAPSEVADLRDFDDWLDNFDCPSTAHLPLETLALNGFHMSNPLDNMAPADPSQPMQVPRSDQGNDQSCMSHAVVRVVHSQLQHKYGMLVGFEPFVATLIEATASFETGLDIYQAVKAVSAFKAGILTSDKSARVFVNVTVKTYWEFDDLVCAVRNSHGQYHVVTGTVNHAVVAHSVEPGAEPKVLCMDSSDEGLPSLRLGRLGTLAGSQPTSQFYCFHVLETTITECFAPGSNKKKRLVPPVVSLWAGHYAPSLEHGLMPHKKVPLSLGGASSSHGAI